MKNHYVPEFYFAPWTDDKNHLAQFCWRQKGLATDLRTSGQICYRRDLHTFNDEISLDHRDAVEHWLTKEIDSKAAPVIKKICSEGIQKIDTYEAAHLVHFIMSLIVRRPESILRLTRRGLPSLKKIYQTMMRRFVKISLRLG